jgi:hypothetical protein
MTPRRILLSTLCAAALFAVGCSDETSSTGTTTTVAASTTTATTVAATTTTVAATTTSSTTTSSTTTTVPASTTTTIAPVRGLPLSATGLGDALFGADADGVVDYVSSILGIPTTDSGWIDPTTTGAACPGTEVRFVDWNDLSLFFTDDATAVRHFASFTYGPAFGANIAPYGLATDADVGVGSTVAQLRAAYPTVNVFPEDGFNGPGFEIVTGLYGFLTGTADTDTIMSFVGGFGCGE